MPRQDVPYGGAICRLRERIAEIFDKLGEKLHTINGVPGDGDGNVKIVSGSSAVVISNDPTQNEIAVSLDTSQLPAAAVSSVNGQTGAVALDAGDIPTVGGDVQADLQDLANDISGNTAAINAEALARQGADSTLQTNINSSNGRISVLETEDANNMKLNRNQTATGDNTFTGRLKAQGQPTYTPSQPTDDVATIGTLDAYTPMVRTTGNVIINGSKLFSGVTGLISDTFIYQNGGDGNPHYLNSIYWMDKNQFTLARIYLNVDPDGKTAIGYDVLNTDGSHKYGALAIGDVI